MAKANSAAGVPDDLKRASRQALDAWPAASAVVLFGSRARGDCHAGSDWDLAFITDGPAGGTKDVPEVAEACLEGTGRLVQCLVLTQATLRERALDVGTLGRAVARDGVLVAGDWSPPSTQGAMRMNVQGYRNHWENAGAQIVFAGHWLGRIQGGSGLNGIVTDCNGFIKATANAAEHCAKAILHRLKVDYDHTHVVAKLADLAERAGHIEAAREIAQLNGLTGVDRIRHYEGRDLDIDVCMNAVRRLKALVDIAVREALGPMPSLLESEAAGVQDRLATSMTKAALDMREAVPPEPAEDDTLARRQAFGALMADVPLMAEALEAGAEVLQERDAGPKPE